MEVLANISDKESLNFYSSIEIEFDASLVTRLKPLPKDWKELPIPQSTRDQGHNWLINQNSAVLCVPSVIVPSEDNYVLNPAHPDFAKIKIGKPKKLAWDGRLT